MYLKIICFLWRRLWSICLDVIFASRLQKALTVESICEEGGLAAGLRLLSKEEKIKNGIREEVNNGTRTEILTGIVKKIRKKKDDDILVENLYASQDIYCESVAQQSCIPVNIARRFEFSMIKH